MAMGGDALGLLYFCGIKFAGYTAMAAVLRPVSAARNTWTSRSVRGLSASQTSSEIVRSVPASCE